MKKSEKLLDAIGQIDDRLVAEAAKSGRAEKKIGRTKQGNHNGKAEKSGRRASENNKNKRVTVYRLRETFAVCAALVLCIGAVGFLSRSGMLPGPFNSGGSSRQEVATDTAAGAATDTAAGAATDRRTEGMAAAEAAPADSDAGDDAQAAPNAASGQALENGEMERSEKSVISEEKGGKQESAQREEENSSEEEESPVAWRRSSAAEELSGQMEDAISGPAAVSVRECSGERVIFVIENKSDREILFGEAYDLERFIDGSWQTVAPEKEIVWKEEEIVLESGGMYEETVLLDAFYGKLQPGQYRIVKSYMLAAGKEPQGMEEYPVYAEFTISR